MRYKILGPTGLRVSELCLGAMTFGDDLGWGASLEECRTLFNTFLDHGGNFIDTANSYTKGNSEKIVGQLSKGIRDELVIATKYTMNTEPDRNANAGGNHRRNMVRAVEKSLQSLQTDYIDIYWVHMWDRITPYEEIMRGLDDLISAGKVVYAGISDAPAWWIAKANMLSEWHGCNKFVAMQLEYNLLERGIERELLPLAKHDNLGILAWSPLAMGLLTGKYRSMNDKGISDRGILTDARLNEHNLRIIDTVIKVADEVGASSAAVALRWLQYQHHQIIPIVGVRKLQQLQDNLSSLQITLDAAQLQRLEEASKIDIGFPYDLLNFTRKWHAGLEDRLHGKFRDDMLAEVALREGGMNGHQAPALQDH